MTNFLEDKAGGFEPISKIAKVPEFVEEVIEIKCRGCYSPMQVEKSALYNNRDICQRCEIAQQKIYHEAERNRLIPRLGGLKAYNQFTLAKYTNKPAIESCSVFPTVNLFLWGTAGTGKTHLATAIIREHDGIVIKPQRIYRECRGIKDGAEEQAVIDSYVNIPFLVIDDLGVEKKTDFSFSTLYEVIDGRDMAEMKGLIVTSNLSLSALAERLGDDRISSRLAGMCKVIEITGKDMRANSQ